MVEDNLAAEPPPEEQLPTENPEDTVETPPKRRIFRRRLASSSPSAGSTAPKQEINTVLESLYGADRHQSMQEITMQPSNFFSKLALFLFFGVLLALAVWGGFFLLPKKDGGGGQASLTINGPTALTLGATTTYSIAYANNSAVPLNNAVLSVSFPEGFVFLNSEPAASNPGLTKEWNLQTLSPYQKGTITITGLPYGSIGEQKSWRVFLNYLPENFNSDLQKAATLTTGITYFPIKLSITGPDKVSTGAGAKYIYTVQRDSGWNQPLLVAPLLPTEFNITSSSPGLDKNFQWSLSPTSTSATFWVSGKFTATSSQALTFSGTVLVPQNGANYKIADAQLSSSLVKNDFDISLAVNGTVSDFDSRPGDTLNMTVRVKNSSGSPITNATVKLTLTAPAKGHNSLLDWANIVDKNDGTTLGEQVDDFTRRGTVTWSKDQIPGLAKLKPNDEISIDLQLPIKGDKDFDLSLIKDPQIVANVEAHFKDAAKTSQAIITSPINISLNSNLVFTNNDEISGQTHTINWVLNNTFHPLKNITITATTYGDLDFTLLDKGAGDLVFDKDSNKVTWTIPEMPDGTDVLNASYSLTLKKSNPTQTLLLSKTHLTAEDEVTGKTIDLAGDEINLNSAQ